MTPSKEAALRRRILKPYFLTVDQVAHFYKSDSVTYGFRRVEKIVDGKKVITDYPIEVARKLINPQDPGCPNWHFLTNDRATVTKLARLLPRSQRPWMNDQRSTYSYGLEKDWYAEPAFSMSYKVRVKEWTGRPGPRHVGPFWVRTAKAKAPTTFWLQGRKVEAGDVSDLQVDTTLNGDELSYVEKVAMLRDRKAWSNAVRAGELPSFTE